MKPLLCCAQCNEYIVLLETQYFGFLFLFSFVLGEEADPVYISIVAFPIVQSADAFSSPFPKMLLLVPELADRRMVYKTPLSKQCLYLIT